MFEFIQIGFGYLLGWFYELTNSYGVALILFTIALKLVLLYPTMRSKRSTMKMSRMTPELQKLQEKYKDDPVKQQQEVQALYKREKYNPIASSVPMIIQVILLMGVIDAVKQMKEIRVLSNCWENATAEMIAVLDQMY